MEGPEAPQNQRKFDKIEPSVFEIQGLPVPPDFATIAIDYVPDALCVELKSLKLYLWSYRDEGAFHEAVTNKICDDIVAAIAPRAITVTGKFWVRGGIGTTVTVTHAKS